VCVGRGEKKEEAKIEKKKIGKEVREKKQRQNRHGAKVFSLVQTR
jgi:hypothetical protein